MGVGAPKHEDYDGRLCTSADLQRKKFRNGGRTMKAKKLLLWRLLKTVYSLAMNKYNGK